MKGYKGFENDFAGKEKNIEVYQNGAYFCTNPLAVWAFYPPCNKNGELNNFVEVEALSKVETDDNIKFCTSTLRIGKKFTLIDFVNIGIKTILDKAKNNIKISMGSRSTVTNTDNHSAVTSEGDYSAATNAGNYSAAVSKGDCSAAINSGKYSTATNEGDFSVATSTNDYSVTTTTGCDSIAVNTGDYSVVTSGGDCSATTNTGNFSVAINTGDNSVATSKGFCSTAVNTGDKSTAINTGDCSSATVEGENSIAIVTGYDSKVKGTKGGWIVCAERDQYDNILCVKVEKVDGEKIKENVFYTVKDGEFVEVN